MARHCNCGGDIWWCTPAAPHLPHTFCHHVAALSLGEEDIPSALQRTWCPWAVNMRADKNGRGVLQSSYFMQALFPIYKFMSSLYQSFEEGITVALLRVRKQRRREINFYYVNFYTTFGWPGSNTDLPVSWPNLHAIFFAIPSCQIFFDTWTFWFGSNQVFISHDSELTLPPPVSSRMPVIFRKQIMETFYVTWVRTWPRKGQNYIVAVCFAVDDLNGALKYNEMCLTGTGRDPGTATFCPPVSEPMGGNLLLEAWAGGEDPRSMPVCL